MMYQIEYTISTDEDSVFEAHVSKSLTVKTEQEAWKIFDEVLFEQKDLFSLQMYRTDQYSVDTINLLDLLDITYLREDRTRLEKSIIDLEGM